ncbi:hypothetical protein N8683_01205 [bacterium]|nr:hypothetical protein [bacterium]
MALQYNDIDFMKAIKLSFILLFTTLGCVTNYDTKEKVSAGVTVNYDSFRGTTKYVGPSNYFDGASYYFLRGWSNSNEAQLYVRTYNGYWHFFNSATDNNQNDLELHVIAEEVDSNAMLIEQFGIDLPKEYLRSHLNTGITVKAYGKGGSVVVHVPPYYVEAFYQKAFN